MTFKHSLLATSALLAAFIGASAHAQTAAPSSGNTIAELVVTAEKREQSLQDVPVAISAFTSEQRDVVGIQSIQDMTNFTPGLQYSTSTDRVSLRGLGRLTNVLSADASVANYADGVYETFAVRAGSSTLFLDRVEILRGPQGTLYGRNSIAGAINIISRRPTDTPYAEIRATYGNYNRSIVEGAISGPLGDRVQVRLAANWESQTKGWIDNTVPGMPDEGNVLNTFYVEGQIQVQFSDKFEMWTKFGYTNWRNGAGGPGSQSGGWSPNIYSADPARPNQVLPDISATNPNGGNGYNILEFLSTNFNSGFGCSGLATNVVNASNFMGNGCINAAHYSPWKISRPQSINVRVPNAYTVASQWTYHADKFDIKYIAGGVRYWYHLSIPAESGTTDTSILQYNAGGLKVYPQERYDYQERNGFISQELNLVSTGEGKFQWIAGGYYFHQHYRQPTYTEEDPRQLEYLTTPVAVCLTGMGAAVTPAACKPGIGRRYEDKPSITAESYAVYGQASYDITPEIALTGGLRYSHDRKYGSESTRILCFGLPDCFVGIPPEFAVGLIDLTGVQTVVAGGTGVGIDVLPKGTSPTVYTADGFATRHYDASWSAVTGTAKVEWHPDEDTNAYASYTRGYRSGGFNIGIITVLSYLPYSDKETVDAFELGVKKNWGRTLQTNFALYNYDYKNLQIPITVLQQGAINGAPVTNSTTSFYNTPKSRSRGFEAEILWQPIENLQLIANYSYIDAEIRNGTAVDPTDPTAGQAGAQPIHTLAQCAAGGAAVAGDCVTDNFTNGLPGGGFIRQQALKGGALPNAPKNKIALAANYTWVFDAGSLTGSVQYSWRDKTYGSIFKRWYYQAPSWDQVDARLLWKDAKDKFEAIVYVKNIFDTTGYDQGATADRLEGNFSNIYGPSPAGLTCSPVVTGAGNPAGGPFSLGNRNCVQGIRKTLYTTPPRTYGIELRYKFF